MDVLCLTRGHPCRIILTRIDRSSFFFFFCQELLRPLGEIEFLPGRLLQKLIDIGFCGGKWSEQACYDLGEYIFGFDDSNNNMVSKIMLNEKLVFNEKLVLAYKWL